MPTIEEQSYYMTKTLEEIQGQVKDLYEIHHACSKGVGIDIVTLSKNTNDDLAKVKVAVAELKIKSGLWGAAAGLIPTVGVILFLLLKGLL